MPEATTEKRFYRTSSDKKIAGVCGGIAKHQGWDPTVVRVAFIILALMGGLGIIVYAIFWAASPEK